MTTEIQKPVTCASCQHLQIVNLIFSTNTFGSPDLERSTTHTWVQSCDSYGYCVTNIEKQNPHAQAVINSPA